MNLEAYIDNLELQLKKSPIRCKLESEKDSILNSFGEDFKGVLKDLEVIKSNIKEPVKVVIMGEVKAGKSTLLNSILEKEISKTDVIESTAAIIEVYYSEQEEGIIVKKNGEEIKGSFKEITTLLEEHHRDLEFFSECEVVKLGLPLKSLKKVRIVDTPGVATITDQNRKTSEDYIQNADVVLWVFNSNQIGQEDIEEYVENVAQKGKKIIGILNKIDEIDGSSARLIKIMRRSLGIYIDDFFPVSAYLAFNSIEDGNKALYEESGIVDVLNYIEENIEIEPDKLHIKNLISSTMGVIDKEIITHKNAIKNLGNMIDIIKEYKESLRYHNNSISEGLTNEFRSWFENEFFRNEEIDIISSVSNEKKLNEKMNSYLNDEYVKNVIQNKLVEIENELKRRWEKNITLQSEELSNKIQLYTGEVNSQEERNYYYDNINSYNFSDSSYDVYDEVGVTAEKIGQGVKSGAAIGVAMSGYFAWLAPGAAHVTIGTAMSVLMPPALIAGGVIGGISAIALMDKKNKEKAEIRVKVSIEIENMKKRLSSKLDLLTDRIYENSNKIYESLLKECHIGSGSLNIDYMLSLEEEVSQYIMKITEVKNELENNAEFEEVNIKQQNTLIDELLD